MWPAEQQEVAERRLATVGPVANVMGVAPAGRSSAAGEPEPPVTHHDRSSEAGRHDLGAAAELERLGVFPRDHPDHIGVAGEAASGFGRDLADVLQLRALPRTLDQRLEIDRDHHVRALAADGRTLARGEPLATDLAERIGSALRGRAKVWSARRTRLGVHLRPDRGDEPLAALRVQLGPHGRYAVLGGADVQAPALVAAILVQEPPRG